MESSGLLCGGYNTEDSCLMWSPDTDTWEKLLTLDVGRAHHVSWTPGHDIGTYLMGGWTTEMSRTTTLVKPDGTQAPGFALKYNTTYKMFITLCRFNSINYSRACAIHDEDRVIITGGEHFPNTVSVYTVEGWQKDLPQLGIARTHHACSSYWADERRVR